MASRRSVMARKGTTIKTEESKRQVIFRRTYGRSVKVRVGMLISDASAQGCKCWVERSRSKPAHTVQSFDDTHGRHMKKRRRSGSRATAGTEPVQRDLYSAFCDMPPIPKFRSIFPKGDCLGQCGAAEEWRCREDFNLQAGRALPEPTSRNGVKRVADQESWAGRRGRG